MYARLKALYLDGRLSKDGLHNAVLKGWITEEQEAEILSSAADTEPSTP